VIPTRQSGEKQSSSKTKKQNCHCMLYGCQTLQRFDLFYLSTKEILKQSIKKRK
jgi:hypothetical protein